MNARKLDGAETSGQRRRRSGGAGAGKAITKRRLEVPVPFKPTPQQLRAAQNVSIPDLIAPDLAVLFCGINPGLYSGATGHHFARPGNRFWPALHASGFTPRLLWPWEEQELLSYGLGITNLVARTTAAADELAPQEFVAGAALLKKKIARFRPRVLAVLGVSAFRHAFGDKLAAVGPQPQTLAGAKVWVLPNPSGLNAHYKPADLAAIFRQLRTAAKA